MFKSLNKRNSLTSLSVVCDLLLVLYCFSTSVGFELSDSIAVGTFDTVSVGCRSCQYGQKILMLFHVFFSVHAVFI